MYRFCVRFNLCVLHSACFPLCYLIEIPLSCVYRQRDGFSSFVLAFLLFFPFVFYKFNCTSMCVAVQWPFCICILLNFSLFLSVSVLVTLARLPGRPRWHWWESAEQNLFLTANLPLQLTIKKLQRNALRMNGQPTSGEIPSVSSWRGACWVLKFQNQQNFSCCRIQFNLWPPMWHCAMYH